MNLYVHFPFCRRKCGYCALHSRPGVPAAERDAYGAAVAQAVDVLCRAESARLDTVYFGGGSPALCDLRPVFAAVAPRLAADAEFTVELHPLDVDDELLARLRDGGVNRVSMGVQSLDDETLSAMGRGHSAAEAARRFARVRKTFANAGVDFIVGLPGDPCDRFGELREWGLAHASVYSLQNERGLAGVPDDDWVLDRVAEAGAALEADGLERYEISNYARAGMECRHNLAVWRGEDYAGVGEGAHGRLGLARTRVGRGWIAKMEASGGRVLWDADAVSPEADALERRIFRLRTREGLDASGRPEWADALAAHVRGGLLTRDGDVFRLTARGAEVCDAILSDLV